MKRWVAVWGTLLLIALATSAVAEPASDALRSMIETYAKDHEFSGTLRVEERSRRLHEKSFGLADRAFGIPAANDTRYRIASVTKLFTSVLILQLHDEGKLDLSSTVRTCLPDIVSEIGGRVAVHQLLHHTSGLPQFDAFSGYQEAFEKGMPQYQRPMSVRALLELCSGGKLVREPGTAFEYNNADYIVLGAIIERLTGQPYETALKERILKPLGLNDTGMFHWDAIVDRLATTYFFRDDTQTLIREPPIYYDNWYAAGAMYSTAADLACFADALYGGKLLKSESLDLLLKPDLDEYGFGLWCYRFERDGKSHSVAKRPGRILGANAVLYRLRDRDATIVILSNTNKADLDDFAQRIADLLVKNPEGTGG